MQKNQFTLGNEDSIPKLFKTIKESYPAFRQNPKKEPEKITKSISNLIDALNPIRNNQSLPHPNADLLHEEDAQFVIDVAVACIQYIAKKVK